MLPSLRLASRMRTGSFNLISVFLRPIFLILFPMLIFANILYFNALRVLQSYNLTRQKWDKSALKCAKLGKNNEPIKNPPIVLTNCKSVVFHHFHYRCFPMLISTKSNWWLLVDTPVCELSADMVLWTSGRALEVSPAHGGNSPPPEVCTSSDVHSSTFISVLTFF